ncbi:SHOCT domain-containing protein [Microbacterium esteraromaticum]|uniref:SHOCT domain-containing protein n=1 Tax=Microbacterium esteraromaticum TaxID=57043 RepID=UPI0019D40B32|nr:SHOCT domain-containing protein [Microbacterium esteraromaticum]MBN7792468.1 SHOCT domain-containing protein [Microbacterium esteraromaticum]MCA1306421.1 SHOCT domain-containing protein [Microbacterium esteraromaticum]
MPLRRVGRPGLIGLAARTAVVAGTASAVQGSAARRQQQRAQQEQYQAAAQQAQIDAAAQQAAAQYAPAPVAPAPQAPAADAGGDMIAKLQQLSGLHDAGVLSDDEFAAAKQKLLS